MQVKSRRRNEKGRTPYALDISFLSRQACRVRRHKTGCRSRSDGHGFTLAAALPPDIQQSVCVTVALCCGVMGLAQMRRVAAAPRGQTRRRRWGKAPSGAAWRGPTRERSSDRTAKAIARRASGPSGWATKDGARQCGDGADQREVPEAKRRVRKRVPSGRLTNNKQRRSRLRI